MRKHPIAKESGRTSERATSPARAAALPILLLAGLAVFVHCRQLKMESFDSITGNFSDEFAVAEIDAAALRERQQSGAPTLLIDVRTEQEQSVSVIPGARTVAPEDDIGQLKELRDFLRRYRNDSQAMVVVYCAGGYRSARSLSRFADGQREANARPEQAAGSRGVPLRNLRGGIIAYANAGGELQKSGGGASTRAVHGYNAFWASFILAPARGTTDPEIPPKRSDANERAAE